jgi:hypothetical protein
MLAKDFYPEFDFPDRPVEKVMMDLSHELIESSWDKWDGVTLRRPDLHALGIEFGTLALQRYLELKQWAPSPGPPLFLILCVGYQKARNWSDSKNKWEEAPAPPLERPKKE